MDESEWQAGRHAADGFLRGSEMWDEARAFKIARTDGSLSFEEVWKYLQERRGLLTHRFDADGDGTITSAELNAVADKADAKRMSKWFKKNDSDADGKVTSDEAAAKSGKRFKRLDANGDGYLSKDEILTARRSDEG